MKAMAELVRRVVVEVAGVAAQPKMRAAAAKRHHAAVKAAAAVAADASRLSGGGQGSQPAVVKMASYGGGARVGAMLNYVSRGGELAVENENGERLQKPRGSCAVAGRLGSPVPEPGREPRYRQLHGRDCDCGGFVRRGDA